MEVTKKNSTTRKSNSEVPRRDSLNEDAENRFDLELCWCIQKLQMSLANDKLQDKQASEFVRSLNILKSVKAPLVKKRQAMRNTLGDYRAKMLEEENKLGKTVHTMKFMSVSVDKKSMFVKKASKYINQQRNNNKHSPCNEFKFNFEPSN